MASEGVDTVLFACIANAGAALMLQSVWLNFSRDLRPTSLTEQDGLFLR